MFDINKQGEDDKKDCTKEEPLHPTPFKSRMINAHIPGTHSNGIDKNDKICVTRGNSPLASIMVCIRDL